MKMTRVSAEDTKQVMIRLLSSDYDKCRGYAEKANLPLAVFCRRVIESVLKEGIQIEDAAPAKTG